MKKWIVCILLIMIAVIGYNYVYQDHRNISNEMAEFDTTADIIINEFKTDMSANETKYLNKTIAITGQVSESNTKEITLNTYIFCQLIDSLRVPLNNYTVVKLKGRFIGYDELLEQIKLDQCIIVKH